MSEPKAVPRGFLMVPSPIVGPDTRLPVAEELA